MPSANDRRQWPGTVPPAVGSPPRRPASVRRTTTVDIVRPEGPGGDLVLEGQGRDLWTHVDGRATTVVAEASTQVVIDFLGDRQIRSAAATPSVDGLHRLVGARAGSGFRRQLAEALPALAASGSLTHLLLDETTPATLISGSSLARDGLVRIAPDGDLSRLPFGICAGWQPGGAMEAAIVETGVPLLGWGPPAPDLDGGDPIAWHPMASLPSGSLRRRRRLDVWEVDGDLEVDVRYRDSYWEHDGSETVVHEYGLRATVDRELERIRSAVAVPGPLPAPECPSAAASASELVGIELATLRDQVRDRFVGSPTCTHLNDVFRSLADVGALWRAATAAVSSG